MTDEVTLIHQLKETKSKEAAFRELISQYKERLYWHIRKIVISHDDADDVLQNTFIKVFKNIETFKGDSKLYSWMYRIATNESITFINKRAKDRKVAISEIHSELAATLQSDVYFSGDEIQLILQKAIATLPTKQQLVFNMKYFDELKYSQMSEILSNFCGRIKGVLFSCSKKNRKIYQQNNN